MTPEEIKEYQKRLKQKKQDSNKVSESKSEVASTTLSKRASADKKSRKERKDRIDKIGYDPKEFSAEDKIKAESRMHSMNKAIKQIVTIVVMVLLIAMIVASTDLIKTITGGNETENEEVETENAEDLINIGEVVDEVEQKEPELQEGVPEIKNYTEYVGMLLGFEDDESGRVYYFDIEKTGVTLQGQVTEETDEADENEEIIVNDDSAPVAEIDNTQNDVGYRGNIILLQGETGIIEVEVGKIYKLNISDAMTMSIPPQAVLKSIALANETEVEYFNTFKEVLSNYEECLSMYMSGAIAPDEILSDAIEQSGYWTDEEVNAFKEWFKGTYADVQYDEKLKFIMNSEERIESITRALEAEQEQNNSGETESSEGSENTDSGENTEDSAESTEDSDEIEIVIQ